MRINFNYCKLYCCFKAQTISSICPLSGWHAQEGDPSCTHEFELTHGMKIEEPIFHVHA